MSFWLLSVTVGGLWVLLVNSTVKSPAATNWIETSSGIGVISFQMFFFAGFAFDDAAEAQYRVMRAMSPSRKVALVEDANRTARRLALAGIQMRCPDASDEERSRLLIDLLLGEELAERAFGPRGPARGR